MTSQSLFIVGDYILRLSDIDRMWHTEEYGEEQIRMFVGGSPLTLKGDDRIRFVKWLSQQADVSVDDGSWFSEVLETYGHD